MLPCYLSLSPYNPFFYLNTFSHFSFLFQESLCLRCVRKICHHTSHPPWRLESDTSALEVIIVRTNHCPLLPRRITFVSFSSTRQVLILMDFLSLAVLLVTVVRRVRDIFRFVDRVQPVKVKSAKREKGKDTSSFPHWAVLSTCSLHCPLFVKIARKFTMMTKRPAEEKLGVNQSFESILRKPLWAGQCQRIVQHDTHSFYLVLCWVS